MNMNTYVSQLAQGQAQAQGNVSDRPSTEMEAAISDLSQGLLAIEYSVGEIARRVLPAAPEAVEAVPAPGRTTYGVTLGNINARVSKLSDLVSQLSTRV